MNNVSRTLRKRIKIEKLFATGRFSPHCAVINVELSLAVTIRQWLHSAEKAA